MVLNIGYPRFNINSAVTRDFCIPYIEPGLVEL